MPKSTGWAALSTAVCLSWTVCCGIAVAQEKHVTSNDDWRTLPLISDGEIADGWTFTGYGEFRVVDGALRSVPDERGLGLLFYDKETFGDCRIRVVFRTEKVESNSGVYIRIGDGIQTAKPPLPAERNPDGSLTAAGEKALVASSEQSLGPWYAVHHGYEVQICDSADPAHGTGALYSLAETKPSPPKPGEWRTMIITLDGDKIAIELGDGPSRTRTMVRAASRAETSAGRLYRPADPRSRRRRRLQRRQRAEAVSAESVLQNQSPPAAAGEAGRRR
jgi:hypothetical protein